MEYYPHEITFYTNNFQDINTFYLQCNKCGNKNTKSITKIGIRVATLTQPVNCLVCRYPHYFDVDQMCLTFVLKFFPNEPIVKNIPLVNDYYVDLTGLSDQTRTDAYNIFHNYIQLLKVLESP